MAIALPSSYAWNRRSERPVGARLDLAVWLLGLEEIRWSIRRSEFGHLLGNTDL